MKTKEANDRDDQDTRNLNAADWEMMQKIYLTKVGVKSNLDNLSADFSVALLGYHLCKDIWATFDAVNVTSFKTLVKYLDAKCHQARNYKSTTGMHFPFSSSAGGKTWLIY